MKTMTPWIVTGAAGFLGSHVVEQLLKQEISVIGIDNFMTGSHSNLEPFWNNPQFDFWDLDIRDVHILTTRLQQVRPSVIIHLAALHFIPAAIADPPLTVSLNVHGTQCILTAARMANVETICFASTGDVYAPSAFPHQETEVLNPFNIYGLTKLIGERLIQLEAQQRPEAHFLVGRLFNLYGSRETNPHILPEIFKQIRECPTQALKLGNLYPRRDMVPVADAATAIIETAKCLPLGLTTLNIATGKTWSMQEIINLISEICGVPIQVEQDAAKIRPVERPHLQANVSRLKELIGWSPSSDMRQHLIQLLQHEGLLQPLAS